MADDTDTWAESRRYNSVYGRFSNSLPGGILFESFLVRKVLDYLVRHCSGIGLPARLCPTAGHPAVLAGLRRTGDRRPHYLVYGHYDVQPPDPLELWQSPPFEPRIAGRLLYARGSSDNQGQHFAHLKAAEACFKIGEELPSDLTFVIDGEEEMGSQSLRKVIEKNCKELDCEGVVISDTGMPGLEYPVLTCARRQANRFNGTS